MPSTSAAPFPADPLSATPVSAATTVVGVIGDPVAHSLSPLLHNTAFAELGLDWVSLGFRVAAGDAGAALTGARALGMRGLSVTMPHKETLAGLVDRCTPSADRLGAVNCVIIDEKGSVGDNTDGAGLVAALRRGADFDAAGGRCVVIGAGGAARAVVAALADAGAAEVVVVNRSPERAVAAAALAGAAGRVGVASDATGCRLVVNATPLGMTVDDRQGGWPVDPELLGPGQLVVDLVYHPRVTPWLDAARGRGAQVANGLGMLVHQAALQLAAWTGFEPPVEAMWQAVGGSGMGD
jgi:shikimate dehydrogenase